MVDADIQQFFDQIPHAAIRSLLRRYQLDEALINLISECLFSQQLEQGTLQFGAAVGLGIPQGSSLSPLIANLYLDSVDEALLAKQYNMVRYADDFVILTRTKAQAQQALELTQSLLAQLNLSLNEEKTQICSFADGFEFLGHTFINDLVLDNKSQTPVEAKVEDQQDITQTLEQNEALNLDELTTVQSPEIDSNAPLSNIIFDREQWSLAGSHRVAKTHIQLPPKLKTLYVTTQGAVLSKNALRIQVKKGQHLLSSIPTGTLDGILLFGRVHMTNDVMSHCLQQSIPIVLANQSGSFKGIIDNYGAYSETLLRQQVQHTASEPKQLRIAKHILKGKFNNSLVVLKRAVRKRKDKSHTEALQQFSETVKRFTHKLARENSPNIILGIEGQVAKQYFALYQSLFADEWQFTQRNRQPQKTPLT